MEEFVGNLLDGAFSVAVAAFLLIRMESRLDDLTAAITRLQGAIETMARGARGHGSAD